MLRYQIISKYLCLKFWFETILPAAQRYIVASIVQPNMEFFESQSDHRVPALDPF